MLGANNSMVQQDHDDGQLVGPLLTLDKPELDRLSELFRLLGDRTRLSILQLLSAGETNVGKLCQLLSLPQPTVSHHLSLLRVSGLIDNRRAGKQVFYRLNGRISPAALPGEGDGDHGVLQQTEAASEILQDEQGNDVDPTGMQIKGRGFAVQILASEDGHPTDATSH
ncbi:MAG: metalloregulator ArsR/SmtB family transcription factor [Planctomycetota bacterium]